MANVYGYPDFVKSTGFGSVTGLKGANCYHDFWPFLPGIQKPNYSESQLAEMNKSITEKRTYNGREYTLYEATQRQRYLERCMRARADQVHLMELGGAAEADLTAVKARYRTYSQEYAAFSKAMGLPQQRERVTAGRDMLGFQPPAQDDNPPANPPTGTPTNPPTNPPTGTAVSMDIGLPNPKSTGSYGDYQTGQQIPPKGLTNGAESGTMNTENQKTLRQMLADGTVSIQINPEMQNRHFLGTKEYQEFLGNGSEESYFLPGITYDFLQQFLRKRAGTGQVHIFSDGRVVERIDAGFNIAYDTIWKRNTSWIRISYSKKRTHISPYTPMPEELKENGT